MNGLVSSACLIQQLIIISEVEISSSRISSSKNMYIFDTSSCMTTFIKLRYFLYSHVELITSSCYNLISSLLDVSHSHHNRKCCLVNFFDLLINFGGLRRVHGGRRWKSANSWYGLVLWDLRMEFRLSPWWLSTSPAELLSLAPLVKLC